MKKNVNIRITSLILQNISLVKKQNFFFNDNCIIYQCMWKIFLYGFHFIKFKIQIVS